MTESPTDVFCGAGSSGQGMTRTRRSREYRALMAAITTMCGAAAVSAVVPVVEQLISAALVAAGLVWVAVVVIGRERRIRARLADPRTRPAPAAGGRVPGLRAGPGAASPALPAPTTTPSAGAGARAVRRSSTAARGGTPS